jgi:hypothetical protein
MHVSPAAVTPSVFADPSVAVVKLAEPSGLLQPKALWNSKKHGNRHERYSTSCRRRVYLDLGANWANTLRLHHKLQNFLPFNRTRSEGSSCSYDWEIYSFEPSPVMQPYVDAYAGFLNGKRTKPILTVPPIGGTLQMLPYAKRLGCPSQHDHRQYPSMYACMNRIFAGAYSNLQVDVRLNGTALLQTRMDEAASPNSGGRNSNAERYTFIPAAAGVGAESIDVSWPSGLFFSSASTGTSPFVSRPPHIPEHMRAPVVDVPTWVKRHFSARDLIIIKMDVEGAEHRILRKMATDGTLSWVSVLG